MRFSWIVQLLLLLAIANGCGGSAAPDRTEVQACFTRASDAFIRGDHQQACESYTAALELGGLSADHFVEAYIHRAVARAHTGDTAGAHADLDAVAEAAPNVELVHSARAFVYTVEGKRAQSTAELSKARARDPDVHIFGK